MSTVTPFPSRREPIRTAVLELLGRNAEAPGALGPEEAEFLEALRRIVARSPAETLWEKYHGSRPDSRARILARYAD